MTRGSQGLIHSDTLSQGHRPLRTSALFPQARQGSRPPAACSPPPPCGLATPAAPLPPGAQRPEGRGGASLLASPAGSQRRRGARAGSGAGRRGRWEMESRPGAARGILGRPFGGADPAGGSCSRPQSCGAFPQPGSSHFRTRAASAPSSRPSPTQAWTGRLGARRRSGPVPVGAQAGVRAGHACRAGRGCAGAMGKVGGAAQARWAGLRGLGWKGCRSGAGYSALASRSPAAGGGASGRCASGSEHRVPGILTLFPQRLSSTYWALTVCQALLEALGTHLNTQ